MRFHSVNTCSIKIVYITTLNYVYINESIIMSNINSASDNWTMENNIQRNGDAELAKGPPPVPIAKGNPTPNNLGSNTVKKDKRMNSSRFNISKNRELTPLSRLAGKWKLHCLSFVIGRIMCFWHMNNQIWHRTIVFSLHSFCTDCVVVLFQSMTQHRGIVSRTRRPICTEIATMLRSVRFYRAAKRFEVERSQTNCLAWNGWVSDQRAQCYYGKNLPGGYKYGN